MIKLSNDIGSNNFSKYITKVGLNIWELNKSYNKDMNVVGKLFLSDNLMSKVDNKTISQISNVASLPGIVGSSIGMPDIHSGYGFTIGGVGAFDESEGVIVPGGVGFDINCGVRLIRTNITKDDFLIKRDQLLEELYFSIPSGLGENNNKLNINNKNIEEILLYGNKWAIENGYGVTNDLKFCEEAGSMDFGSMENISKKALNRGKSQIGTIGSGNHFVEVQYISDIFDKEAASVLNLYENQICIMIHCGSRGLGHQICTDYLEKFNYFSKYSNINIKDPELVCAPIDSKLGLDYYQSMICGANYAWVNRQIITYNIRSVFEKIFKYDFRDLMMDVVYDLSHNIIKKEEHILENSKRKLYVHRKGATRSFPPNHKSIPYQYSHIGQPVLIPGSMGTPSYVLCGSTNSMKLTFGSACHGSGRVIGRADALKLLDKNNVVSDLLNKNILVKSANISSIASEAPSVYKSSDEVVNIINTLNIARKVAKLNPLCVIKG